MATPNTNCINGPEFTDVYPPSEDSFLFLDALECERNFLNKLNPNLSIEVGVGSGIISTFLCSLSDCRPKFHLLTDISSLACLASQKVLSHNLNLASVSCDIVNCSLASPFLSRLKQSVDLILFNPPYVTTSSEEYESGGTGITASWAGGSMGRKVIDRFLHEVVTLLSPKGCLYLLLSDENIPTEVHNMILELSNGSLTPKCIIRRRVFNEFLAVYRYSR